MNNLIDQALDEGDFEKVKMLSGYLPKESAQIYLRELERINELHSKRNR
jgi:division protein CdvB (Snf7/Vps24/ESCRT-III family)